MKAEAFWNLFASRYSKSPVKDIKGYNKTLGDTKKYLKKGFITLEIGCGTGTTALILTESVKTYTATDISKNMIAIGKEKAKRQNVQNVNFMRATLFDGNLKKGHYDGVLAFNLLHLLEDVKPAIRKVNELLKPNGLFISKTPCLGESISIPFLAFFIRILIGPINCFTLSEFKKAMTDEGFEIIDSHIYPEKPPRFFAVARKIK